MKFGFWTQEQVKEICRRNNYCSTLSVNGKQCSQFDPRISSAEKRRKNNAKKVDETTWEIQTKLNGMGFQAGVADGLYGTKTKNALNQFYRSIGKLTTGNQAKMKFVTWTDIRVQIPSNYVVLKQHSII